LGSLDEVGGVLAVGDGLVEAVNLGAQALRDDESGGVIGGAVDAQTAGEFLDAAADGVGHVVQITQRVQCRHIGVDLQSHAMVSSMISPSARLTRLIRRPAGS